jgi:UPF0755 protein
MKKYSRFIIGTLLLLLAAGAWIFLGPATGFSENSKYLYIYTSKADKASVMESVSKEKIVSMPWAFEWLASRLSYWKKIKPGRYEIKKGDNLLGIVRKLRNGRQSAVKLVINKIRTREELAGILGRNFECDSISVYSFLSNNDSLKRFGLDSNTAITAVIPNTYLIFWNTSAGKLFRRFYSEQEKFWNSDRLAKAKQKGLSKEEIYTLASIVEEETIKAQDKPLIASVYINRMKKGMNLGADPTIKFALKDFTLKRILSGHITRTEDNPFNTYKHKGLPPGPICTPSAATIDAVLDAPATNYLFFCARPDFSGLHAFAASDKEHLQNATKYHRFLDSLHVTND